MSWSAFLSRECIPLRRGRRLGRGVQARRRHPTPQPLVSPDGAFKDVRRPHVTAPCLYEPRPYVGAGSDRLADLKSAGSDRFLG